MGLCWEDWEYNSNWILTPWIILYCRDEAPPLQFMIQSRGLTGDDRQIRGVTTLVTRTEASVDWSWWQNIIIKSPRQLYHFAAFMFRTLQCGGHSGWCLVIGCWWPLASAPGVCPPGDRVLGVGARPVWSVSWPAGARLGQHRASVAARPGPRTLHPLQTSWVSPVTRRAARIESRDTSDTSHRSVRRQRHGAFLDEYFPTFCISVFY